MRCWKEKWTFKLTNTEAQGPGAASEFREIIMSLRIIELPRRIRPELMSSQKGHSGEWGTCICGMVQTSDRVTKRCQDCRTLILKLGCMLDYRGRFKKYWCLAPAHSESDLIALECGLDMKIVQSSPGDSNVHPRVRTSVWIPGATSSWRTGFLDRAPSLPLRSSNCFTVSLLFPLSLCST